MKLLDLLQELKTSPTIAGIETEATTDDGYHVYFFWHIPSINLSWYPIMQIDKNDKCVFWKEGPENEQHWKDIFDVTINWAEQQNKER